MECKYCGGIVRAFNPGGMRKWVTQCGNCGRYNCEKEEQIERKTILCFQGEEYELEKPK